MEFGEEVVLGEVDDEVLSVSAWMGEDAGWAVSGWAFKKLRLHWKAEIQINPLVVALANQRISCGPGSAFTGHATQISRKTGCL